jgi:hypothetical protein
MKKCNSGLNKWSLSEAEYFLVINVNGHAVLKSNKIKPSKNTRPIAIHVSTLLTSIRMHQTLSLVFFRFFKPKVPEILNLRLSFIAQINLYKCCAKPNCR